MVYFLTIAVSPPFYVITVLRKCERGCFLRYILYQKIIFRLYLILINIYIYRVIF